MKPTQTQHIDISMNTNEVRFVYLRVSGEDIILMRLERNADGSLDFSVVEMANDDMEITNTYPEFFPEVAQ